LYISKTPFRISFFGGGTDLPDWYEQHGGAVISSSINKYCYITCRNLPSFYEYKHRLVYSLTETINALEEIKHPGIRGVFEFLKVNNGLEIHHDGDLPAKSGLGSSSSFTIGLLNVIQTMQGISVNKTDLAKQAIVIEREILNECVGSQDQIAASFGGFNRINFLKNGSFDVVKLNINDDTKNLISDHLLLIYTGIRRHASEIEKTKVENISKNKSSLRSLRALVDQAQIEISNITSDPSVLGEMLHETWMHKMALSPHVSNDLINEIYKIARIKGALGGKILGAGGGGFLLIFAPPERHCIIENTFRNYCVIKFKFENQGTTVLKLND